MREEHFLYNSRFLKEYCLAVLQVIEKRKFNVLEDKEIISADLVPRLARVLVDEYSLNDELIKKLKSIEELDVKRPVVSSSIKVSDGHLKRPKSIPQVIKKKVSGKRVYGAVKRPELEEVNSSSDRTNGYQKIKPLIQDYSVSRIQCIGPNKPLIIIRSGQKQVTKLSLNASQIKDVFEEMAEEAHVPLIEGPFKIILDGYSIDGIYSSMTNARFIIQKQTAYSLLEQGLR